MFSVISLNARAGSKLTKHSGKIAMASAIITLIVIGLLAYNLMDNPGSFVLNSPVTRYIMGGIALLFIIDAIRYALLYHKTFRIVTSNGNSTTHPASSLGRSQSQLPSTSQKHVRSSLLPQPKIPKGETSSSLKATYSRLAEQRTALPPLFGFSQFSPENFNFLMPGIAVMASLLREKHHVSNLWVCQSLNVLKDNLKNIETRAENQRHAFIVPTHASGRSPGHPKSEAWVQHCLSICVEKVDGHMHIYVLEIMVTGFNTITLSQINLDETQPFTEIELVLSHIDAARLNATTTTLYNTTIQREFGWGGCSTFGLKDALYFLRDADFSKKLVISKKPAQLLPSSKVPMLDISALPPEHMQLTESSTILSTYAADYPILASLPFGPKKKTLGQSMKKHFVMQENGRKQNTLISHSVLKYHHAVISQMQQKTDEEILMLIHQTLL